MDMTPSRTGGRGSIDVHASERRDPNKFCAESQPAIDRVSVMMPWLGDEERNMRIRLDRCQSLGARRATTTSSDTARMLFWTAAQEASAWTFAPASLGDLTDVRNACLKLFCAANGFERVEGEFNARAR